MKDILLFGIQGSGKGTQSAILQENFENTYSYFSSGDLFRALMSSPNAIGNYLKERMERCDLIDDSVSNAMFEAYFHTIIHDNKYMLLDGFPRTIPQMQNMMGLVKKHNRDLIGIHLVVPDDVVKQRMLERGRNDDTVEGIQHRIDQFYEKTQPTINWFRKNSNLYKIDANRDIEIVANEINTLIH